ncbi:MAG: glycoside hydrolase [Bacteroidota bacterium]
MLIVSGFSGLPAQDPFPDLKNGWLEKAEDNRPHLVFSEQRAVAVVAIEKDEAAFQGYSVVYKDKPDTFYSMSMNRQSGVILDFGRHMTGFVSIRIEDLKGVFDGALRLKFTFAEVPAEAVLPFDPYSGSLSRAWLQDEILTLTEAPASITIPRRVAFRYVKIEVLGSSPFSDFRIADLFVTAGTSAKREPPPLLPSTSPEIRNIDAAGLATLRECMQTVYEDGPKRDRRLWVGDLYLESLANIYSFKNDSLTRRCLYLLAGLCYTDGTIPSNVFERPYPHPQISPLLDYALIYIVALREYLGATGDTATAADLWCVAKEQAEKPLPYISDDGMIDYERAGKDWWLFFDWNPDLDKQACLQGCVIWAFRNTLELARALGKEEEVAELPALIDRMTKAARKNLYDKKLGLFISGKERQLSYASQAWMVLGGVAGKEDGARAFRVLASKDKVIEPVAPYLYHFVIEAMISSGMDTEARKMLNEYWGGMLSRGADTFWEVFVPSDDFASPYGSFLVNSYCHAWSCTPVYFIRKYPGIFQQ